MQLFDTPGKDDLHKVHCFFGFGKGFDLSLCYGTTNIHHSLYAQASLCSKNPNTNKLRLRRRACKARERLNYSSLGLGQGDAHDHHQNHPNKYLPMFIPARKMTLLCFSCSMLPPQHTDSSVAFFHLQPFSQPRSKVSDAFFPFFGFHAGFPCPVCFHTTDSLSPAGAQQSVCPPAGPSYLSPQPITRIHPKLTNERGRPAYGRTHPCASTLSQLKHFVLQVEDVI